MKGDALQTLLMVMGHKENRRLLEQELRSFRRCFKKPPEELIDFGREDPSLLILEGLENLEAPLDLIMADGPGLKRGAEEIARRKAAEKPRFLPVLLLTSRQDLGLASSQLWRTVDELVLMPVQRTELRARLAVLLRARILSLVMERKNEDFKAMVYLMAHDLAAPVRAIEGLSEAALEDFGDRLAGGPDEYLQRILRAAGSMRDLMDAVMDFARLEGQAFALAPVELKAVVEEVMERMQPEMEAATAQVTVQEGPWPRVLGVHPWLVSVLKNLLSNALKFVPAGRPPRVSLSWESSSLWCRVRVRDQGIGIPAKDQQRIFSAFHRLHGEEEYPGIGLGLTATKRMMELMRGHISVTSAPGDGSEFVLEFMRCEDVPSPSGG
ncbi:His Kinase A (phospho-acceptor) domain-containing protein [Desulfacinum hydrothermale DSM 13146]|uniref:histidine kinase n=1 Tax=Desulfacinum hydrothermale DSM 13146 TaxID=1121390 RepID=A0A1W1XUJ5_9BACT|nr:HAMP domain-containing sensor histidine kinase [Desulfacinum hydrothermale]SMC27576.1 His Kinase A (phospho-acceptor) domain-containing protein [Desulfacinum hydrothermale DSM 13146]